MIGEALGWTFVWGAGFETLEWDSSDVFFAAYRAALTSPLNRWPRYILFSPLAARASEIDMLNKLCLVEAFYEGFSFCVTSGKPFEASSLPP